MEPKTENALEFDGSNQKQKKYLQKYIFTISIVVILYVFQVTSLLVGIAAWGENSSLNTLAEIAFLINGIMSPVLCLLFIRSGWGNHRFNFRKNIFLGFLALLAFCLLIIDKFS